MPQIIQTRTSLKDIDGIWDYIAENSPTRASQFVRRLKRKLEELAANPYMGRARPELDAGLRSFPFEHYVVIYRPVPEGIEVVRILHGRQDIDALFR